MRKMNKRAECAFLALPEVIDQLDTGVRYLINIGIIKNTFVNPNEFAIPKDPNFTYFKIDLTYLIEFYVNKGYLTQSQRESLYQQINSSDKENWLIAFMLIDNLKHKLWFNEKYKKSEKNNSF